MNTFSSIYIFKKPENDTNTVKVCNIIEHYANINNIILHKVKPINFNENVLFVSVGGDGTMLTTMRTAADYKNSTVLGLNTGTLGFLTEKVPVRLNKYLDNIMFNKDIIIDKRMVLSSSFPVQHNENETFKAVNEFVLTGKSINAPLVTEVFINNKFVNKQLGNGVLVSTSTGSTAMSLSAGGVIVSPATNTMQIVPLVPHTLTSRPIITSGRDIITIRAKLTSRVPEIEIHGDGQILFSFNNNSQNPYIKFTIKRHEHDVNVWRPNNWNFFNVLAEKMKW